MPSIGIVPFQLSLESMVLLREVFFSIMFRVSPSVPPFKCFMCWHVYILEMVVTPIRTITTRTGDREGASPMRAIWEGET